MKKYSSRCLLAFFLFHAIASRSQEAKLILPIGHSLGVSTAVFSPDGKRMVTSALDNNVKIWEVSSGLLLANLRGHTDTVRYANYSPDGKKIVTACEDGTAKIWDAEKAELIVDLKGHRGMVYYAGFSPDGKQVLTSSQDHSARLYDASTGKLLFELAGHTDEIWECWFSPDGKKVITSSFDSTARIWDAATGKLLSLLKGNAAKLLSGRLSPDGKLAATSGEDSLAKIWNAETGQLLFTLKGHKDAISFVSFSPDGKKVLTGSDDGHAIAWDATTGKELYDLLGKKRTTVDKNAYYYPDLVSAAHFSPDGTKILTVYLDSSFKLWDAATGKLIKEIKKDYEYTNSAGFSPDSKKVVLALAYAHAIVWDISTGNMVSNLKGRANNLVGFNYSPDGKRILTTSWPGSGKLLDASTGGLVALFDGGGGNGQGVYGGFSRDGKRIIAYSISNETPKVYDAVTGALLFELKGHTGPINYSFFGGDGRKIFTSARDSTARIWDGATGKLMLTLKGSDESFNIDQSPDGKKLLAYSPTDSIAKILDAENGHLITEIRARSKEFLNLYFIKDGKQVINGYDSDSTKIWDAENGKLIISFSEPGYRVNSSTITPNGEKIILIFINKKNKSVIARLYELSTGKLVAALEHEGASFRYLAQFSPDKKEMLMDSDNGIVTKWDVETGAFSGQFQVLSGPVYGVNYSPDGKKIGVGSLEGAVRILDAQTGALLKELKGHTFSTYNVSFSPDSKYVITVSQDNTAKVWDLESGNLLYTYVSVDENDFLILDKENHFDGTEGARKLLYFSCGTELVELDQVKDQLWVPNLAERVLKGETINAVKLSDLNICNLTPLVETIDQSSAQYKFRVTPRIGGLGNTVVYVNGIEMLRYTPQQLQLQKGDYYLTINKTDLSKYFASNKDNTITVKSFTAKTSISSRALSISEKTISKDITPPNLYAVVVGISDYKGEDLDLKFASKDAIDIGNAIDLSAKKLLNGDGKEHVFIYKINTGSDRDRFPEKNSIKAVFQDIAAKSKPNDILLVFFAGHGVMESEKNKFYFLTADASNATVSGALKDVGISTEELSEWIKPQVMKAQKRILIFDACNSGQAIKELVNLGNNGQGLLASRGDEKGKQIKALEKLNERSGMFILSASASDQKAYEMAKYSQGILTYSLLKAIKEDPEILEDRKYLNISRWFDAAEKTVSELARETGARQQPQLVSTTNFNVGMVDDEVRDRISLPFEKPLFTRSDFRNSSLRLDNLKLRVAVDKQLADLSDKEAGSSILFNLDYDGANVYSISGDYKVNGSEVIVSLILTKGGAEIETQFEVRGTVENINDLATAITGQIIDWLKKKDKLTMK